ncbi:MAG: hypothetical protein R3B47_02380 [Bacteroidia bacterium]
MNISNSMLSACLALVLLFASVNAQTLMLRPGPADEQDAQIHSNSLNVNRRHFPECDLWLDQQRRPGNKKIP